MNIDKLISMTSVQLDAYLAEEVEKIIASAPAERRQGLRELHEQARAAANATSTPLEGAQVTHQLMADKLVEMNEKAEQYGINEKL